MSKNTTQCPQPGPGLLLDPELCTNHEATTPPKQIKKEVFKSINWTPEGKRKVVLMAKIHLEEDSRGKCLHVHVHVQTCRFKNFTVIGDSDQKE